MYDVNSNVVERILFWSGLGGGGRHKPEKDVGRMRKEKEMKEKDGEKKKKEGGKKKGKRRRKGEKGEEEGEVEGEEREEEEDQVSGSVNVTFVKNHICLHLSHHDMGCDAYFLNK